MPSACAAAVTWNCLPSSLQALAIRFLAQLIGGRRGHDNALGVDHLAHDAAGAVGRADEYLRLSQIQMAAERSRVVNLCGGDLWQAAEQCVAARVGAGQEDAQPAQKRREERIQLARAGEDSG